jgi:hypothetical protein
MPPARGFTLLRVANPSPCVTHIHPVHPRHAFPSASLIRCYMQAHLVGVGLGWPAKGQRAPALGRYSSNGATVEKERVEPPDYLDEKERAIFEQLRGALNPVALEVSYPSII